MLMESNQFFAVGLGPKINFQACLWILVRPQKPHHIAVCWLSIQRFILLLIFCLETTKASSGPKKWRTLPSVVSLSAITLPRTPECSETQTAKQNTGRKCHSTPIGTVAPVDGFFVLAAWRSHTAAWLSEQILTNFSGLPFIWISCAQAKIAHISDYKTVAHIPKDMLSLLTEHCPKIPALVPLRVPDPSVYQKSPVTTGKVPGPLVHFSLVSIVILYFGSRLNTELITSTPRIKHGIRLLKPHQ